MKKYLTINFYILFLFFNLNACTNGILVPKGWMLPDVKDFQDTWRNADRNKYLNISGDFNGDQIIDMAMLLVSENKYGIGLFAFLGQINGEFKAHQLCEISGVLDEIEMGIRLVEPGSYKTAYGKGYFDRERLEDEPDILILTNAGIDLFEFESANSIYYWSVKKNKFIRVWISD